MRCIESGDRRINPSNDVLPFDVSVLPPLALVDMDDHPLPVDGARHQVNRLADAQAGGVASGQDGPLLDARDTAEKMQHLLGTENDRQGPRLLGTGHRLDETHGRLRVTR
jgi:hypothetical protein